MKYISLSLIAGLLFLLFSLSNCSDECEQNYTYAIIDPVYLSFEELRSTPLSLSAARSIENPGNIEPYGEYLFINEIFSGIHVIDNSVPENPRNIGFIELKGNFDIDITGDILYADHYTDLLAIDISSPASPQLLSRSNNAFLEAFTTNVNGILIGWEEQLLDTLILCTDPEPDLGAIARWWPKEDYEVFVDPTIAQGVANTDRSRIPFDTTANYGKHHYRFLALEDRLITFNNLQFRIYDTSNPENMNRIANFRGARAAYALAYNDYIVMVDYWRTSFYKKEALLEGLLDFYYLNDLKACMEPSIWASSMIVPSQSQRNNPSCFTNLSDTNGVFVIGLSPDKEYSIQGFPPLSFRPTAATFTGPERFIICAAESGVYAYNFNKTNPVEDMDQRPINPYSVQKINATYWVKAENGLFQYSYSPSEGKLIELGGL